MALRQRTDRWRSATSLIPGGVNSPVRAMRAVGVDEPVFIARGAGGWVEDVEGFRGIVNSMATTWASGIIVSARNQANCAA